MFKIFAYIIKKKKSCSVIVKRQTNFHNDSIFKNKSFEYDCQLTNPKKYLSEIKEEWKDVLKCRREVDLEMCLIDEDTINPLWEQPKVVIIGAGIAGLSAGARLAHCGITDTIILEASDRIGGRIFSTNFGNITAEMGAKHIYGASVVNPIFTLACQEGLLMEILEDSSLEGITMNSAGKDIGLLISCAAFHTFKLIEQQATDLYNKRIGDKLGNLGQFIQTRIEQELTVFPEKSRIDASNVLYGMTNDLRAELGTDLNNVSIDQFGSYSMLPSGKMKVLPAFGNILNPIIRNLPDCNIKHCKQVSTINWEESPKVVTSDGEIFNCDYVIITPSLGVLKNKHDSLFVPNLPKEKVDAINKLGYGKITRIYLEYDKPFWIWREGNLKLAWSSEDLTERDSWVKGIGTIEEELGSQQILSLTIGDREAQQVEQIDEIKIAEDVTKMLRRFTNDCTIPYPVNVIRSKWNSNDNFQGARSYIKIDSTVQHQWDLEKSLPVDCGTNPPKLFFAGEATAVGHFGTVHGARLSGIREADKILKLTRKYCGKPSREIIGPPCDCASQLQMIEATN